MAGVGVALVLALLISGCQYFRQSTDIHMRCATATSCIVTLVSGADTTNTLDWSITSDERRVVISPASGSIRPGTLVSIAVTLPADVCPIELHGSFANGTENVGLWGASVTELDGASQRCENFVMTHPM